MDEFKDIKDTTNKLEKALKKKEQKVRDLESKVQKANEKKEIAEKEAIESERKKGLAVEKYKKGLELKNEVYQELIHDIFEVPKQRIVESIIIQSKKSNRKTRAIAIISIAISIIISIIILFFNNKLGSSHQKEIVKSFQELKISLEEVNKSVNEFSDYVSQVNNRISNLTNVVDTQLRSSISSFESEFTQSLNVNRCKCF